MYALPSVLFFAVVSKTSKPSNLKVCFFIQQASCFFFTVLIPSQKLSMSFSVNPFVLMCILSLINLFFCSKVFIKSPVHIVNTSVYKPNVHQVNHLSFYSVIILVALTSQSNLHSYIIFFHFHKISVFCCSHTFN